MSIIWDKLAVYQTEQIVKLEPESENILFDNVLPLTEAEKLLIDPELLSETSSEISELVISDYDRSWTPPLPDRGNTIFAAFNSEHCHGFATVAEYRKSVKEAELKQAVAKAKANRRYRVKEPVFFNQQLYYPVLTCTVQMKKTITRVIGHFRASLFRRRAALVYVCEAKDFDGTKIVIEVEGSRIDPIRYPNANRARAIYRRKLARKGLRI